MRLPGFPAQEGSMSTELLDPPTTGPAAPLAFVPERLRRLGVTRDEYVRSMRALGWRHSLLTGVAWRDAATFERVRAIAHQRDLDFNDAIELLNERLTTHAA